MNEQSECRNCASPVQGDYCPHCGQSTRVDTLHTWPLIKSATLTLVDLDGPVWRTVRGLLWRPGLVALAYVDGQRQRYVNPFRFCLLACVLVPLAMQFVPDSGVSLGGTQLDPTEEPITAPAGIEDWVAVLLMILLLPLAAVMSWFARRLGMTRTVAEWYVVGLFTYGEVVLFQIGFSLIGMFLDWVNVVSGVLPLIWYAWAVNDFVRADLSPGRRWILVGGSAVLQLVVLMLGGFILGFLMSAIASSA